MGRGKGGWVEFCVGAASFAKRNSEIEGKGGRDFWIC